MTKLVVSELRRTIPVPDAIWTRLALYLYPSGIEGKQRVVGVGALVAKILEDWLEEKGVP